MCDQFFSHHVCFTPQNIGSSFVTRTVQENMCFYSASLPCLSPSTSFDITVSGQQSSQSIQHDDLSSPFQALKQGSKRQNANSAIVNVVNAERARYYQSSIQVCVRKPFIFLTNSSFSFCNLMLFLYFGQKYDFSAELFAQSITNSCTWTNIVAPSWSFSYYKAFAAPSNGGGIL
jgi:hypothetical protein